MPARDDENPFIAFVRALVSIFSGIVELLGYLFSHIAFSGSRHLKSIKEQDEIRALGGGYDSDAVFKANSQLSRVAGFPSIEDFMDGFYTRFCHDVNRGTTRFPHHEIRAALVTAAGDLYTEEGLHQAPPPPPLDQDSIEQARYRDKMLVRARKAQNPKTLETIDRLLRESMEGFIKHLPGMAIDESDEGVADAEDAGAPPAHPMIGLTSVIPDLGESLDDLILPLFAPDAIALDLFFDVRKTIQGNADVFKIAKPSEYKGAADQQVHDLLKGTKLERIFKARAPFLVPEETRYSGHWIIAPPGRGKTTLLHSMIMEDLRKDATVILMDSKGDLIDPIRELKQIESRLIIIDADPDHPIAINPLDIPKANISLAVSNLEYVFSSLLESKMTPLQTVLFRSVLRALITSFPNPTLETFRDVLTNGIDAYRVYIDKLPKDLQDFFSKEFNTKVYEDRRKEIIWRLRLLLENDTMRGMMLALRTRFNIGEAMDAGKVIIISNSKAKLGDQGAEFFGRFFIAQVLAAAQQRSGRRPQDKKPVYFYIDECQNVIARDERIPIILDECRSQKVALILAHQRTEQITSPNVMSALSNCAIRYANSDDEARTLAPKLRTNPEFLYSLKRGHFAAFVRDMTSHAIAFQVSKTDFSKLPRLSAGERAVLAARMQTDYGVLPEAAPPDPAPPVDPSPPDTEGRQPETTDKSRAQAPPQPKAPPRSPEADPSVAGSTTQAAEPRPAADASDPQTGEHTEPAAKWGEK